MPQYRPLSETKFINDANLVAYYKLEDTSDSKGSYTLTNNNSVAFNPAKFANGADFGSANTNKSLVNSSLMGTTVNGDRTMMCWMKMNTELSGADTYQAFMSFGYATEKVDYELAYWRNGATNGVYALRNRYLVGSDFKNLNGNLGTTNWNHFALTFSGTTLSLYINGALIGSSTVNTGNGTGASAYTNGITIGADAGRQSGSFQSCITDDVAKFTRAFSSAEINEAFQGMTLGEYLPNSNTKLLLHLNGNSTDSSGNGNNGTDTNITYSQANGRFGMGAGFASASNSKIVIGTSSSLAFGTGDFTISYWLKANIPTLTDTVILRRDNIGASPRRFYSAGINATTGYNNFVVFNNGSADSATTNISVCDNTWKNIILTRSSAGLKIYINGSLNVTGTSTSLDVNGTSNTLKFGTSNEEGAQTWYNGALDEPIFENIAWTPQQVAKYYANAKGRYAIL